MSYIQEQCHLPKYVPYLYMEEYKLIMNINLWIGLTSITSSLQKKNIPITDGIPSIKPNLPTEKPKLILLSNLSVNILLASVI